MNRNKGLTTALHKLTQCSHDIYIGFWRKTPSPVNLSKLLFVMDLSKTYALKKGLKDW